MRSDAALALLGLCSGLLAPGLVAAQETRRVHVEVMVTHISPSPGPVDPRARRLHEKLHAQLRYESVRVLQQKRLALALDELGGLRLPNGRQFRLRPLDFGDQTVLMAVSVEGTLQTDMRIHSRRLVAIRAGRFEDGSLVISIEPDF